MKIIRIIFLLAGIITLGIAFNEYLTDVNYKETTKCCKIIYITQEYNYSQRTTDYIFLLEYNRFSFTKEVGILTASKYQVGDTVCFILTQYDVQNEQGNAGGYAILAVFFLLIYFILKLNE